MKRSELSETRAWEKDSGGPVKVVCHTLIHKHTHRVISKSSDYRYIFIDAFMSLCVADADGGASTTCL